MLTGQLLSRAGGKPYLPFIYCGPAHKMPPFMFVHKNGSIYGCMCRAWTIGGLHLIECFLLWLASCLSLLFIVLLYLRVVTHPHGSHREETHTWTHTHGHTHTYLHRWVHTHTHTHTHTRGRTFLISSCLSLMHICEGVARLMLSDMQGVITQGKTASVIDYVQFTHVRAHTHTHTHTSACSVILVRSSNNSQETAHWSRISWYGYFFLLSNPTGHLGTPNPLL